MWKANSRNVRKELTTTILPIGEGNGNLPVFLPGEFHAQRSLVGYSQWGCKELDPIEKLSTAPTYINVDKLNL